MVERGRPVLELANPPAEGVVRTERRDLRLVQLGACPEMMRAEAEEVADG